MLQKMENKYRLQGQKTLKSFKSDIFILFFWIINGNLSRLVGYGDFDDEDVVLRLYVNGTAIFFGNPLDGTYSDTMV